MFIPVEDEMAIPSEIGLYFNFEVTEDGLPYGCPGFERFTAEWIKKGKVIKMFEYFQLIKLYSKEPYGVLFKLENTNG